MKYINTFSNEKSVSQVALGCMRLEGMSQQEVDRYLMTAVDCGYNYFDHADIYGGGECERLFGKALAKHKELRDKIVIQTKCSIGGGMYNFEKDYIVNSVNSALSRLGVEKIDVLLLHRPDLLMEPCEVAEAFDILHSSGKVEAFGVSNHSPMQIALLQKYVNQKICINQLQLSLVYAGMISNGANVNMNNNDGVNRDGYVRDYCRLNDITIQPWSPLQFGFIYGCFLENEGYADVNNVINRLAEKYGTTDTGIAIAWLLRLPDRMQPILGSTNLERLKQVALAADITLSRKDWYELYSAAGYELP